MESIAVTALLLLALGAYFAPSVIALSRHVPNAGSVVVINTLLGWTLVGWVVSMAMAARSVPPQLTGWQHRGHDQRFPA